MFITKCVAQFGAVFFSIALHELGHTIISAIFKNRVCAIKILPVGLNVSIGENDSCTRSERIIVYLSGPAVNILLFGVGCLIDSYCLIQPDNMRFFSLTNIYFAFFNLIPVLPFDGGKILREAMGEYFGLFLSNKYLKILSLFLSSILIILGIIQTALNINNFSLIIIGVYVLYSLKLEKSEVALMNVKYVIYRRARLFKRGVYPARDLVVIKSMRLGELLKNMDFDRFHIIYVLDENLRFLKVLTEQEIIDAMVEYDSDLTFEEYINRTAAK